MNVRNATGWCTMSLPAPNLDDRRFQDLVDDAKRLVQRRCPEWTDHNVSDPGVTLIETFAFMTDQLLYRLNRVPDRLYIKFLELIGVHLLPPTPARAPVTFWLSAPAMAVITDCQPAPRSRRSAPRPSEPVVFSTVDDLTDRALRGSRASAPRPTAATRRIDHTEQMKLGVQFSAFGEITGGRRRPPRRPSPTPVPAQCGAARSLVPHRRRRRRPGQPAAGLGGVERRRLDASARCGRTRPAASTATARSSLHVPPDHEAGRSSTSERAGWLRARVVEADDGQPDVQRLTHHPRPDRLHDRRHHRSPACRDHRERGDRRLGRRARAALRRAAHARARSGPARRCSRSRRTTAGRSGSRSSTSPPAARTTATICSTRSTARCILGPDGARGRRRPPPVRRRALQGRVRADALLHDRRRTRAATWPRAPSARSSRRFRSSPASRTGGRLGTASTARTSSRPRRAARSCCGPASRAVTAEDFEQITREAAPEIARVRCLAAGTEGVDAGAVQGPPRAGRGPGDAAGSSSRTSSPASRPSSGSATGSTRPG